MISFAWDGYEIVYLHPTLKLFLKTKNTLEVSFSPNLGIRTSNDMNVNPEGITHIP